MKLDVTTLDGTAAGSVELVVPADALAAAIEALRAAHPYEEVAFDLYPLHTL